MANVKAQKNQIQTTKPQSKKVKNLSKSIDKDILHVNENNPLEPLKNVSPNYQLVGMMNLRRTKLIADASPQTIVLPNDIHQELVIRGIKLKYTWDELVRNILTHHLKENPTSDFVFTS